MSAWTSVQVDAKQPDRSSAGEVAPLKAASPWRSREIETLCWRWRAAARPPHNLPPFEELALDGLGGLADSVALLHIDDAGELNILRAGKVFEAWIDRPAHKLKVAELSIDRARTLRELHAKAVNEAQPVQAVAHGIVNGSVCVYDLVALPLSNRFGPLFLVYVKEERERKFSLIEAMFQATTEGLSRWPSFATPRAHRCISPKSATRFRRAKCCRASSLFLAAAAAPTSNSSAPWTIRSTLG
jgi:hypothetical protein